MELNELGAALAKAQAEMHNPKFDRTNPHFKNKFASLAAVRDAVIPTLAKHGIACVQDLTRTETGLACTTTLIHASGQTMSFGPLAMPISKNDAQGFGSAGTYARRYHLMAVANVVGDEDDDANEATNRPAPSSPLMSAHHPIGDVNPTDVHVTFADRMREAVNASDQIAVVTCHHEMHEEGEEFYRNVWSLLDSRTRSAAKRFIAGSKAA